MSSSALHTPADMAELVAARVFAGEQAAIERLLSLVELDEIDGFRAEGAASLTAWLATRCGMGRVEARRLVRQVRLLRRLPALRSALANGGTTLRHVDALTRAATRPREAMLDEFGDQLVRNACTLSGSDFEQVVARWAELADDTIGRAPGPICDRWLTLTPTLFGEADIRGHLDADQALAVGAALDALNGPDPAHAPVQRSLGERNADALTELALHYLDRGRASSSGRAPARRARATGIVTIDLDTLNESARTTFATDTSAADTPSGWTEQVDLASIRRELMGLGPITKPIADLLLCDADLKRIVLDVEGQPLSIGKPTPTVTTAQRHALALRDGGCVFPTCDRPAAWTDAHHLHHRSRGGPTDVDNLVLLCRHHHRLIHGADWSIERHSRTGRVRVVRSDGTVFQRDPLDEIVVTYRDPRPPPEAAGPRTPIHWHDPLSSLTELEVDLAERLWPRTDRADSPTGPSQATDPGPEQLDSGRSAWLRCRSR